MILQSLELQGFRNYRAGVCGFDPGINVITGRNAQGKTNLLEAVYYLSGARSFRTRTDRDIISMDAESAAVRGVVFAGGREQKLDVYLSRRERKKIFVNGVRMKSAANLAGRLCCVLFSPEDLELIRGAPAARRRFMDLAISQIRPKYAETLAEFHRLYEQKTRILKDYREKPALLDVLDDFSLNLAKRGAELIRYRAAWTDKVSAAATRVHRDVSRGAKPGGEKLHVQYQTVSSVEDPLGMDRKALFEALLAQQERLRQAELDAGLCLAGVHKDDLLLDVDGHSAAKFASQGQVRTAALSLKLAEWELCREDLGESPLLLLDDVLSELDEGRQDYVLNCIGGGQVLITCCEEAGLQRKTGGNLIHIENGSFI